MKTYLIGQLLFGLGIGLIVFTMWGIDWAMFHQEVGTPVQLLLPRTTISPWLWFHINIFIYLPIGVFLIWLGTSLSASLSASKRQSE